MRASADCTAPIVGAAVSGGGGSTSPDVSRRLKILSGKKIEELGLNEILMMCSWANHSPPS
ncbi:hypothetical protein GGTG_06768 [Gaeumannomyces tritici R3-111a-1]|uniref:Uncharacterized protein n=1 Tax=Gaeumannomyces tritici (strain R3-111a-1) TaxID=644352 RepID=J3NZS1_GAET3|nr:hypothetical protein GGTG_06768 [Gaeumannomyces tritici R3-111a-1]EJT76854.1 hypothetical protein GGTG_06768 [Gaeumannomyces tritici R3-111a-1]